MGEEMKVWEPQGVKVAQVGEWVVYGVCYKSEFGEHAWHTTSYPSENPIHDFWVADGEFRAMAIHYMYNLTYENRIWIGDVVHVAPDERKAVEHAVAKWEGKPVTSYSYRVIEKVGADEWTTVASGGGFPTEDDAKAAAERNAERISQAFNKTVMIDVQRE